MVSEPELTGLLYRADWTTLTLSGTVRGDEPAVDTVITVKWDQPLRAPWLREDGPTPPPPEFLDGLPGGMGKLYEQAFKATVRGAGSWAFHPGGEEDGYRLLVAPGRRFRVEGSDASWAVGSDGSRVWHWFSDPPESLTDGFDNRPKPPYRKLLAPAWLLTGYALELAGEETVAGRAGVRVRGTQRPVTSQAQRLGGRLGQNTGGGAPFAPMPRWLSLEHFVDHVEVVVDVELGILLRCARWSGDEPPKVTEFVSLDGPGTAEAADFSAPDGSLYGSGGGYWSPRDDDRPGGETLGEALGEAIGAAGKEAGKAAAGLAAGGLGALIKFAGSRDKTDPFARATAEDSDPEAAMPADEQAPDELGGALPDELLHLVYRSGITVTPFSATLHQWFDGDRLFAAVPESARSAGFGGVGFLLDALRDSNREETGGTVHGVAAVRMGGWRQYRIDIVRAAVRPRERDEDQPVTYANDEERQWQVHADCTRTGTTLMPPDELCNLIDASWLLDPDLDLSGGAETWLDGRRGYRIVASCRDDPRPGVRYWKRLFFPAVAVVDAETGVLLRLTRFKGGGAMIRQELRGFAELGEGADFGFTPPAGRPVRDIEAEPAHAGLPSWLRDKLGRGPDGSFFGWRAGQRPPGGRPR